MGKVDELLDRHIVLVREGIKTLKALEKQLVALRRTCDGHGSHPSAILEAFQAAAQQHARPALRAR